MLMFYWFFSIQIVNLMSFELHKITVAISEQKPFTQFDEDAVPRGLDVMIIEQFAMKHNLQVNYVIVNLSMNKIFASERFSKAFPVDMILR